MTMANKIVVMKDGVIQQVDTPKHLYNNPVNKFVASFIGSPPMNFIRGELEEKDDGLVFAGKGFALGISQNDQKKLKSAREKSLTFGIRPEHVTVLNSEANREAGQIKAEVDVVELLGSEQMTYFKLAAGGTILAKVDSDILIKPGDKVTLQIDMEKAHYFSSVTEKAI